MIGTNKETDPMRPFVLGLFFGAGGLLADGLILPALILVTGAEILHHRKRIIGFVDHVRTQLSNKNNTNDFGGF